MQNEMELIIVGVVLAGIVYLKKSDEINASFSWYNVFVVLCVVAVIILFVWALVFLIKKRHEHIEKRYQEEQKLESEKREAEKELQESFRKDNEAKRMREFAESEERWRLEKLRVETLRREEEDRLVNELFEFKKSKKSEKALPLNKKYAYEVNRKAREKFEDYMSDQKRYKRLREEAIAYYQTNSLDTKPELQWDAEIIYAKVREDVEDGKISLKKFRELDNSGPKLKRDFYRTNELDDEMKIRATNQGFIFARGIELNGKVSNSGFYVKKDSKSESNHHFIMKHLFKEMHKDMKLEYSLEGKRADVAFVSDDLKLAIEIESGINNSEQVVSKVSWLNEHFDKWIFVSSKANLKRYVPFVDGQKSFCLTAKKAQEKVLELLSAVSQR